MEMELEAGMAEAHEEIGSGVYRVATRRGLAAVNVYLIQSGPGWVLIDTAWPRTTPTRKWRI